MYFFELQDIIFAIKSVKSPSESFDINNYISFSTASTRSAVNSKLAHHHSINNFNRHSYFTRLPHLWNAMPVININQSLSTIKIKLKTYKWNHFVSYFNSADPCSFHMVCPFARCNQIPRNESKQITLLDLSNNCTVCSVIFITDIGHS